jgi:hypothetical protein
VVLSGGIFGLLWYQQERVLQELPENTCCQGLETFGPGKAEHPLAERRIHGGMEVEIDSVWL